MSLYRHLWQDAVISDFHHVVITQQLSSLCGFHLPWHRPLCATGVASLVAIPVAAISCSSLLKAGRCVYKREQVVEKGSVGDSVNLTMENLEINMHTKLKIGFFYIHFVLKDCSSTLS